MRIIEKGEKRTKSRKTMALILIPSITITSLYLGIGIFIFNDMSSYNSDLDKYYWWDSEDCLYKGDRKFRNFYEDDVNWTFLEDRAYIYENWTDEYHICDEDWDCATTLVETDFEEGMKSPFYNDSWNYEQDLNDFLTNKTSKFRELSETNPAHGVGDSPMWTGNYMASLAFHYAVACEEEDADEVNEILRKLKRPVVGLHILTHVSGLEGNLARFAIQDTKENRERFESFFLYDRDGDGTIEDDEEREFGNEHNRYPGQGNYDDWWYEHHTSRDQHIGTFFGYSIVYKILSRTECPDGTNKNLRDEILDQVAEDGTDILDCLIGSNWHVINGEEQEGEGRGFFEASLHPRVPWTSGGDIILAFLAFGKMVEPETYIHYYNKIVNRFLSTSYHYSVDQSGGYFGNNLGFETMFQAYFIEEDPDIRLALRHHFNHDFYTYIQYHRNSFFNLGWLYINDYDLEDEILDDNRLMYRLDDITDNLDRFARWRYPSRDWYIPEVDDADELVHPTAKMYSEIFAEDSTHIYNILYGWLFGEFSDTSQKSIIALGTDELGSTDFIWQRNPFSVGGSHAEDKKYEGTRQRPGVDYTLPYWMGRYFGYFKEG